MTAMGTTNESFQEPMLQIGMKDTYVIKYFLCCARQNLEEERESASRDLMLEDINRILGNIDKFLGKDK